MKLHTTDQNQRLPLKAFWSQEVEVIEITTGLVHSTFLVVAGEDRFILQRVNTNVFKEADQVLANIAIVTQHLSSDPDYHLQVPEVVSTLDGRDSITTADESHWRCFSYIKGSTSKTGLSSPDEAKQVAEAFGSFAASLSTLDPNKLYCTIEGFHDPQGRMNQFDSAVDQGDPVRRKQVKSEISFIRKQYDLANEIVGLKLPVKIAHNDPKITNVLFDNTGSPLSIIDLDTVMAGSPLHDFGDMVRSIAATRVEDDQRFDLVAIDRSIYDAIEQGFRMGAGKTLSAIESDHLYLGAAYIIFEQALRFLADYLQGDIYYRVVKTDHNLIRARNQIALLQSFLEKVYNQKG